MDETPTKRKRLRLRGERWLKYYDRIEHQANSSGEKRVRAQCRMCEWNIHWQVTRMRFHLKSVHGIDVAPDELTVKNSLSPHTPLPPITPVNNGNNVEDQTKSQSQLLQTSEQLPNLSALTKDPVTTTTAPTTTANAATPAAKQELLQQPQQLQHQQMQTSAGSLGTAELVQTYLKVFLQQQLDKEKKMPEWFKEYTRELDGRIGQINQNLLEMNSKFMRLERMIEKLSDNTSSGTRAFGP